MNKIKLSIVICTLNRIELLNQVLNKLCTLIRCHKEMEILVIDNNSEDSTYHDVLALTLMNEQINIFKELKVGLSHARNRGIAEASGEWIFFLDDDGMPDDQMIAVILQFIYLDKYKIIGGKYYPWYYYGQEKWMKDRYYGNYPNLNESIVLTGDKRLSGGILLIKKSLFDLVGLFDTELGMKGSEIGYSEETEFQDRLIKKGIKLRFEPRLKMFHVVAKGKMNLNWFFKSKKALSESLYYYKYKYDIKYFFISPFIALGLAFKDSIMNGWKLVVNKDYYHQNFIIDSYTKPYKWFNIFYLYMAKR